MNQCFLQSAQSEQFKTINLEKINQCIFVECSLQFRTCIDFSFKRQKKNIYIYIYINI